MATIRISSYFPRFFSFSSLDQVTVGMMTFSQKGKKRLEFRIQERERERDFMIVWMEDRRFFFLLLRFGEATA